MELKNNLTQQNISWKIANSTINKVEKIIKDSLLFENEFLKKIKLSDSKSYPQNLIDEFDQLSNYDKLCFLIIKNLPQNIIIKVPDTEFYVDYYKKDINRIYGIEKNIIKLSERKTISFASTKVPEDLRNYYIFAVDMNDYLDINNFLKSIGVNLFYKNLSLLDQEILREIYQTKYNDIIKKIDKIIKYIRDN